MTQDEITQLIDTTIVIYVRQPHGSDQKEAHCTGAHAYALLQALKELLHKNTELDYTCRNLEAKLESTQNKLLAISYPVLYRMDNELYTPVKVVVTIVDDTDSYNDDDNTDSYDDKEEDE